MTRTGSLPRLILPVLLITALALVLWQPGRTTSIGTGLEGNLLDIRFLLRGPVQAPPDIAIVAIDDATLASLQRFPVPRQILGDAIAQLDAIGAKVIALDLLLPSEEAASPFQVMSPGDATLNAALGEADLAVLAVASFSGDPPQGQKPIDPSLLDDSTFAIVTASLSSELPVTDNLLLPYARFAEEARLGHVNVEAEADGALRFIPAAIAIPDIGLLPAISLQATAGYLGLNRNEMRLELGKHVALGERNLPLDPQSAAILNYYGPARSIETFSLSDVLAGSIEEQRLTGKAIFLGATASGFGDTFATPFDRQMPGVEALATLAANALDGEGLLRNHQTWLMEFALAFVLSAAIFWAASRRDGRWAVIATILVWVATLIVLQAVFAIGRIWLDGVTVLLVLLVATVIAFLSRMYAQNIVSRRLSTERGNLAQYVSPLIAERLAKTERPGLDDDEHIATILFVDVVGFTLRSERLGPEKTVVFLRALHTMIERASLAHKGVIEHFQGDGAMIVFGLLEHHVSDPVAALHCANQMLEEARTLSIPSLPDEPPVELRVSLNAGPVVTAVLGGEQQGQLTVAGDTVNVSSRLQDVAKENRSTLAVSDAFVSAVRQTGQLDMIDHLSRLPPQRLRGREEPLIVWIGQADTLIA